MVVEAEKVLRRKRVDKGHDQPVADLLRSREAG
jgi:hypothetical protein